MWVEEGRTETESIPMISGLAPAVATGTGIGGHRPTADRAVVATKRIASLRIFLSLCATNPDHAPRGAFLEVWPTVARRRSVRLDRCEATRCATRLGLICLCGGSAGGAPPGSLAGRAKGAGGRPGHTTPPCTRPRMCVR